MIIELVRQGNHFLDITHKMNSTTQILNNNKTKNPLQYAVHLCPRKQCHSSEGHVVIHDLRPGFKENKTDNYQIDSSKIVTHYWTAEKEVPMD